ncbi:(2Fe-2S)-binding protein [Sphingobacterium olei]|uniref:(2Fe-2S)-binding protein n=1 Tax=Sphingobacterium olei TaxID=2571155 RepID=A0A4U0PGA4_9SPHI|nr:(2Fe-2S)-binding protein [Sphingobacterium olei]TJZ61794.1 (2Fe-2S)-binding protein [Sphingobacterium olei]
MKETFTIRVNGEKYRVKADPETPMLYILRNDLSLNGPKFGCGLAQCGACLILLDGVAMPSCSYAIQHVGETEITTLEGLSGEEGSLHPVQQSFFEEQAAQCGYCTNGLVVASVALLHRNPHPTEKEIRAELQRNICRCGVHARAIRAVKKLADR